MLGLELPDGDRFYDDKADVLELNGLAEASSFLLRANREPPEQLLGFLRLLNLSGTPQRCFSSTHGCTCGRSVPAEHGKIWHR